MNEPERLEEIAHALDLSPEQLDELKVSTMERHEKADTLLTQAGALGHIFSVVDDGAVFVNVSWLGTVLLLEADQIMRGHGGCPDHMRLVDLIQTTVFAAVKNVEAELPEEQT